MSDVECPYCGCGQEINHDDGYGYDEDELHQQECDSCSKVFTYTTAVLHLYEASKAPCLNGGNHEWNPTHTIPRWHTKMECDHCGETRAPTSEEMKAHNIPVTP